MEKLERYAELLVREGVNLKQGQALFITGYVESHEFVKLVVEKAYLAGAGEVFVRWVDETVSRLTYLHGNESLFTSFPDWQKQMFDHYDKQDAAYLHIRASNPEAYKGVSPQRLQAASVTRNKALKPHSDLMMASKLVWCVAGAPCAEWARKVFPGIGDYKAVEKLWQAILSGAHADGEDPVSDWRAHCDKIAQRAARLNQACYNALRFKNSLGTDLTVGLPKGHIWAGGGDKTPGGHGFSPNIPTEEIFTAPHRLAVNGHVAASMPLVYQGDLIEGIELTFRDGLVVEHTATKNKALLDNLLNVDEGSRRLGEVALVPHSSPISQMGILFYDTLYDENASCHLALGEAYPVSVEGAVDMDTQQRLDAGLNDSLEHEDFMIGTADMSVTGIKDDGTEEAVLVNGEFAF